MSQFLRKLKQASGPGSGSTSWQDAEMAVLYPALVEFLGATEWAPGESRETGTVMFFSDAGLIKCCLTDRAQSLVAFMTALNWTELLEAIEEGLVSGRIDWRVRREFKPASRK